MQPQPANLITLTLERVAGREIIVLASAADPTICNVVTPRDPEFAALRLRATRKDTASC